MYKGSGRNYRRTFATIITMVICSVLSHSFIPHHHHNANICIALGADHPNADNAVSDNHDSMEHGDDGCMLSKAVVSSSNDFKNLQPVVLEISYAVEPHNGWNCCSVHEKTQALTYLKYKPYQLSHYISYIVPTLGLRGPPLA